MKTNVGIELTDEERLNLGQKYYGKKKPVTRADINKIVLEYIKGEQERESNYKRLVRRTEKKFQVPISFVFNHLFGSFFQESGINGLKFSLNSSISFDFNLLTIS